MRISKRKLLFLLGDIVLISLSVYLSFLLRFEGNIDPKYFNGAIEGTMILGSVFVAFVFYFFRVYNFSLEYVSMNELVTLFKAVTLTFLLLGGSLFVLKGYENFLGFPRSVFLMSYVLFFLFSSASRFLGRIYREIFKKESRKDKKRTLIVGAGDAGEQTARGIISSKDSMYHIVCFADDNIHKKGMIIHGAEVLGVIEDIPSIVKEKGIETIVIAMPTAGAGAIRKAVETGRKAGVREIKIIPSVSEIITGEATFKDIREVEVEDLLGREPVSLNLNLIKESIQGKKLMVIGAAGSIGSELCRQLSKFHPVELIIFDQDETGIFNVSKDLEYKFPKLKLTPIIGDIRDKEKTDKVFENFTPQIVFHAAAYKHVYLMEINVDEAVKNNVLGTKIVAECALKHKAEKFIFISTDKAVNPSSVMGATKRIGEMICRSLNNKNSTKFISVRFGNVLDSRGSVIPLFRDQIKKGGPVEVTHPDMKRYFMVTSEACLLVLQAEAIGKGGEVFVLDMGEPIRIEDLAREMIRLSGLEPDKDIPIVFTEPKKGEKMFEEILTAEEGTIATEYEKIFIARLEQTDEVKLNSDLDILKNLANSGERDKIISKMKEIIPSYKGSI